MTLLLPSVITQRRDETAEKLEALDTALAANLITSGRIPGACVYATGSVGRGEVSGHSDLDVFMLDAPEAGGAALPRIEQILLKADLIRATDAAGFPEFSGDGEYLEVHQLSEMMRHLGGRVDDAQNLFTARLLMLLEGRAIVNPEVFDSARRRIIADGYWRDFGDHEETFVPIMLANDIERFWKTLCLNYEHKRNSGAPEGQDGELWRAKRRVQNLKLGFSRLLMCHSGLVFLTFAASEGSVRPEHGLQMAELTPTQRLEDIARRSPEHEGAIGTLLDQYSWFLDLTEQLPENLVNWMTDDSNVIQARERSSAFGNGMYQLLRSLDSADQLMRYLVV